MANVVEKETPGEDTQHLNAIFGSIQGYRAEIADLKKLLEKSKKENAWLREELRAHQRGERLQIIIEGRTFSPKLDGPETLTVNDDWLNAAPGKDAAQFLTDTLSVFKD